MNRIRGSLPDVLKHQAATRPDATFLDVVGGTSMTYGEVAGEMWRWSAALARAGVEPGSRVMTMLPLRPPSVYVWLGVATAGAVEVPVNTDYRGAMLEHVVRDARPTLIVVDVSMADRFTSILPQSDDPPTVVVIGDLTQSGGPIPASAVSAEEFLDGADPAPGDRVPAGRDVCAVIYTSGTTGPSKGVLVPWAQLEIIGVATYLDAGLTSDGAIYSAYPNFHVAGKMTFYAAAQVGSRVVMRERLSVTDFWGDVRAYGCTHTVVLSVIAKFLLERPPADDDADNPLQRVMMVPLLPEMHEFAKRFDLEVWTVFGSSELAAPFSSAGAPPNSLTCGKLRVGEQGVEVRLVDEHDDEVPVGEVGELIVRHSQPWTINQGYLGRPELSAAAWRNGWFHTGDVFHQDEDGWFYFVDRKKDVIRRRGENISSFEVESYVNAVPGVAESAAVAVPSAHGEDDLRVLVVRSQGQSLSAEELVAALQPVMPRFMLPRYIDFVEEFPKTDATMRTKKSQLRELPLTTATWDAEAARSRRRSITGQ